MNIAPAIDAVFSQVAPETIDVGTLLPASIPLDLSGEAVRARLCTFTDEAGTEVALRPDFTLPVALAILERMENGQPEPFAVRYSGTAFRLPMVSEEGIEFSQSGFERYGDQGVATADAETLKAVLDALGAAKLEGLDVVTGDLGLFAAFVDALDLPAPLSSELKTSFRSQAGLTGILSKQPRRTPSAFAELLAASTPEQAERLLNDVLVLGGMKTIGRRGADEVVERLRSQADVARAGYHSDPALDILRSFLSISGDLMRSVEEIAQLASRHDLSVAPALDVFRARAERIANDMPKAIVRYRAEFGRRFNYYDGFVFEVNHPSLSDLAPVGAGGRYDSLLGGLSGGKVSVPAVGGVVRPDRIRRALEAGHG